MTTSHRRTLIALLATLACATPALAQRGYYDPGENTVRFRLGLLTPEGDSAYFDDKRLDFSGEARDLEDALFGVEYERRLTPQYGFVFGGSFFQGQQDQAYLDFEDRFGNDIAHTTTLDLESLDVGVLLRLAPRHAPIVPYVGGGGSAVFWRLEEDGDFIDFGVEPLDIFADTFKDDGVALGYFLAAGIEVPLGRSWAFFAEGRWRAAEDELGGDFEDFGKLDLSGSEATAGASFRF
jgi:hypothetical protein